MIVTSSISFQIGFQDGRNYATLAGPIVERDLPVVAVINTAKYDALAKKLTNTSLTTKEKENFYAGFICGGTHFLRERAQLQIGSKESE